MILQALYEYYQRKAADPESRIAPEGWEWKEMPFLVVIDKKGEFVDFKDTREGEGREKRAKAFLVPSLGELKGNGIKANLLWENMGYILGISGDSSKTARIEQQHSAFIEKAACLQKTGLKHPAYLAVMKFLNSKNVKTVLKSKNWQVASSEGTSFAFEVEGSGVLTDLIEVRESINAINKDRTPDGFCLVTGEFAKIARLHPPIKGVRDANPTGAGIVAVNNEISNGRNVGQTPAFASYLKEKAANSPVSEAAAFAYTTALNHLLRKDSGNKVTVGDASLVFWAEKQTKGYDLEPDLPWIFADPPKDDPDRGVRAVRSLLAAVQSGKLPRNESSRFYLLGLSPNSARISVRLWRVGTVSDFAEKIRLHFSDLEIVRGPKDAEYLSLNHLLKAIALQYKAEKVPPNLAGEVVTSVLDGTAYPRSFLQHCIRRIRAEHHVTFTRAAILKACVNRLIRFNRNGKEEEIKMALDRENSNPAYRLGRLFAELELIQRLSQWPENPFGEHTTILDRFYGAASSSPVSVFSQLLKLKNHHLGKLAQGKKVPVEKEISEIFSGLSEFPRHLTMDEQARFAIGYYHQRQSFFEKK
jgi:CRISPR-associated protein Csd1